MINMKVKLHKNSMLLSNKLQPNMIRDANTGK